VDDGIRFEKVPKEWLAMCDATAHVYWLCEFGAAWAKRLGEDAAAFERKAAELRDFIRRELFDDATGFFCDSWSRGNAPHAFEGMWPMVVGAATEEQAARVIDENLLNPRRYFTKHPVATVGIEDPRFELRMWRGPAWNSMTFWAAVGCLRYRRADAARRLLEAALDDTAAQYMRTGTIWEFYHPHGERPDTCRRKPYTPYNAPCHNYLGHNPLIAMARMWEKASGPG
jgi:neutral trehalase